jgi:hypothetical protein
LPDISAFRAAAAIPSAFRERQAPVRPNAGRAFRPTTKPTKTTQFQFGSVTRLSCLRATFVVNVMGRRQSSDHTEGWLFRVINPIVPPPRYFVVGLAVLEEAHQSLQTHPDVGDDKVEAVGPVTIPNMLVFEVRSGAVKQIDTPYR